MNIRWGETPSSHLVWLVLYRHKLSPACPLWSHWKRQCFTQCCFYSFRVTISIVTNAVRCYFTSRIFWGILPIGRAEVFALVGAYCNDSPLPPPCSPSNIYCTMKMVLTRRFINEIFMCILLKQMPSLPKISECSTTHFELTKFVSFTSH